MRKNTSSIISELRDRLGDLVEFDKPMAPLTSFGTGGPARCFVSAGSADQLGQAIHAARDLALEFVVIGGGSNLLISDNGYDGLVVRVEVKGFRVEGNSNIIAGAGEDLSALVSFASKHALSGVEFAAGIWGTVGGAIYGNAGAYGGQIGNLVEWVELVTRDGQSRREEADYCCFGYRDSYLKRSHEVIVEACLALRPGDESQIRAKVDEILAVREAKFPPSGTAGCFFKNIPDPSQEHGKLPAGRLLEEAGAKDLAVGGARVFDGHANIIVNTGGATSKEIRALADKMKEKVFNRFGISLEEEVVQIGRFD